MKDPAFLFYSKDWMIGTASLFPAEKGVYIDLLVYQHQNGVIPSDEKRIAKIVGLSFDEFSPIWDAISDKFEPVDGGLANKKLSEVTKERVDKGSKNRVIGTFGRVLGRLGLDSKEYKRVRENFNADDFIECDSERLSECITEWCTLCLESIGNGNADANNTLNTLSSSDGNLGNEIPEKPKNWFTDFEIYLNDVRAGYLSCLEDKKWMADRIKFHPNVNIQLSLEKACNEYWANEAGWNKRKKDHEKEYKKTGKLPDLSWKATFTRSLNYKQNIVYLR